MKMTYQLACMALGMLLCISPLRGNCNESSYRSHCCKNALIGTYTLSLTLEEETPLYGNISFHEGGTLHGMDSADLGQVLPGFPNGVLITVWTGNWKKIDYKTYSLFFTSVASIKDPDNCCISIPFARFKVEGIVTLSQDGQCLSGNLEASFWDLNDLTINKINIVPPFPVSINGRRVPACF